MEAMSKDLRKMEESLKNQLTERADRQDRAIQEMKEQQSKDMEEMRTMFLKLGSLISSQSSSSSISYPKTDEKRSKGNQEDRNFIGDDQKKTEGESPKIFLSVLRTEPSSSCDHSAMRVIGHIKGRKVDIIISSGTTHNFVDENIVNSLGCDVVSISPVTVGSPFGSGSQCGKTCVGLQWEMQGHEFEADMFVVPLYGYQIVLGMQWLDLLGRVSFYFKDERMEMKFFMGNKKVVLRCA